MFILEQEDAFLRGADAIAAARVPAAAATREATRQERLIIFAREVLQNALRRSGANIRGGMPVETASRLSVFIRNAAAALADEGASIAGNRAAAGSLSLLRGGGRAVSFFAEAATPALIAQESFDRLSTLARGLETEEQRRERLSNFFVAASVRRRARMYAEIMARNSGNPVPTTFWQIENQLTDHFTFRRIYWRYSDELTANDSYFLARDYRTVGEGPEITPEGAGEVLTAISHLADVTAAVIESPPVQAGINVGLRILDAITSPVQSFPVTPAQPDRVAAGGLSIAVVEKTLMAMPVRLQARAKTLGNNNFVTVWMNEIISQGNSQSQCKTLAKYINRLTRRFQKVQTLSSTGLPAALAAFIADTVTQPTDVVPPIPWD
jgi:hypothetical protein